MKPEEFSMLGMYGDRKVFEKRHREGYTHVAFGRGVWVGNARIVAMWAFFHPKEGIATHEHSKGRDPSTEMTLRLKPFERRYTQQEFTRYLKKNKIDVGTKTSLAKVLEKWEK